LGWYLSTPVFHSRYSRQKIGPAERHNLLAPDRPLARRSSCRVLPRAAYIGAMLSLQFAMLAAHAPLDVARSAAIAAGQHMVQRIGAKVLATKLDKADLVTAVDRECQEIVEATIQQAFPTDLMLGEESVPPGIDAAMEALQARLLEAGSDSYLWIIDPIDGTTNFVNSMPLSVVSIGIAHRGSRVGAVVYDPWRDELFCAWKGEGATLNGEPMHVAEVDDLGDAVLCAPSPHSKQAQGPALRSIVALMPVARSIRVLGSGVLNFAWVACGRLSAYFEPELAPWDTAAGTLLIEEAGGVVTDMDGSPYDLSTKAVLASAPGVHGELQRALQDARAVRSDVR
jgi:myo-inositol-1(or 4)-monophosphatase